jgi:hypothetical protein
VAGKAWSSTSRITKKPGHSKQFQAISSNHLPTWHSNSTKKVVEPFSTLFTNSTIYLALVLGALSRHLDPRVSGLIYDIRALAAENNRRSGEIWNFAMTNFGVNQL